MLLSRSWVFSLLCVGFANSLSAQAVRGRVLDAATGETIPQATVSVLDSDQRPVARTSAARDGSFVLNLRAPGTYRIQAERIGYQATLSQPLDVGDRETVEVDLRLSIEALGLEAVTVTARRGPRRMRSLEMNGFYERERLGSGRFLQREDIERHHNLDVSQILDRVPGTSMYIDRRERKFIYFDRAMNKCLPTLFLDRVQVMYGADDINGIVAPEHIEAVELYPSAAGLPPQFNRPGASCGAIVIWTRTEP